VSASALAFMFSHAYRRQCFGLDYSFYVSYDAFDVGFHDWRYLELQNLRFWAVVYDDLLYDCAKGFFDDAGLAKILFFYIFGLF
jgi:hypothetical protein